jgi:hypothetical protein
MCLREWERERDVEMDCSAQYLQVGILLPLTYLHT